MSIEFTTTITHKIEIGGSTGINIRHEVGVDAGEASILGAEALYQVVRAGASALIKAIDNDEATVKVVD